MTKQEEIEIAWSLRTAPLKARSELRGRLAEAQNWRCPCCGVRMTETGPHRATLEHIVPRRLGGRDCVDNLAITCGTCNSADRAWPIWVAACLASNIVPERDGVPVLPREPEAGAAAPG